MTGGKENVQPSSHETERLPHFVRLIAVGLLAIVGLRAQSPVKDFSVTTPTKDSNATATNEIGRSVNPNNNWIIQWVNKKAVEP